MIKLPGRFGKKDPQPTKIRKRSKKKYVPKLPARAWWIFLLVPLLLGITRFLWSKVFANSTHEIKNIIISEESKLMYDSTEIDQWITEYMSWQNFRIFSFTKQTDFDSYIKNQFPLIDTIQVAQTDQNNTVYVEIQYHEPELIITDQTSTWLAYKNQTYLIKPADTIQENILTLRIPTWIQEIQDLEWLFYHIHSKTLVRIIGNISEILDGKDISDILYIPWGQKLHISYKDKLILFHLDKSLDAQLAKLSDLKQYYSDFAQVTRLDLWSNNDIIVK